MKVLLKAAKIVDPASQFHNQTVDLQIEGQIITKIAKSISNTNHFEEINLENLHISQGWFDSSVCFGEPGFEDRERIDNGLYVAGRSGFTAMQPNTFPVIDNQSQIAFVKSKAVQAPTQLFPIGALTMGSLGKDLAELYDMKSAGAIAFGDYNKNSDNPNLLKIALQYSQDFEGMVIAFCQDPDIAGNGVANEGIPATRLGLKGMPALSEELQVARNLLILEYTGGKMHLPTISSAKSLALFNYYQKS